MKIVILDGYTENPGDLSWQGFYDLGEVTVYDRTEESQIVARIGDAEAVIVNKVPITRQTLTLCPQIKYIGVLATGYNVIDVAAAKEKGVCVTNIPTYGTTAVAQFVFALLLEICHHVGEHDTCVKQGAWTNNKDWCFWNHPLIELADKTLGIIGYGRIGRAVAAIALSYGMKVMAYDVAYDERKPGGGDSSPVRLASLKEIYEQADVITLHCPLFESTQGMINQTSLSEMKDGVILINTSRGGLIVEQDLAQALNDGKVYAAALDVVSTEPIRADNPLLKAKNCFLTPHIAWAPKESRARLMKIATDNLKAFTQGKPVNVVNG